MSGISCTRSTMPSGIGEEHQVIVRAGEQMLKSLSSAVSPSRVAMPITPLPPRRWAR
jgi:hypothetical protein